MSRSPRATEAAFFVLIFVPVLFNEIHMIFQQIHRDGIPNADSGNYRWTNNKKNLMELHRIILSFSPSVPLLIFQAPDWYYFHTIRPRICHIATSNYYQQIRFSKRNLLFRFIIVPYQFFYFQQMFCAFFNFRTA